MKKTCILSSILSILILLISCSYNTKIENQESAEVKFSEISLITATNALKDLTPSFASVILNSDYLLKELKTRSILKKDGDYDVLFNEVKDLPLEEKNNSRKVSAITFLEGIENSFTKLGRTANGGSAQELINTVPYLNLYYYSPDYDYNFNSSDILITYLDYTVEEFEQTTLIAYNKNGEMYEIDGITPPDIPVIVLGINERTNNKNYYSPELAPNRAASYDGTIVHDENIFSIEYNSEYGTWDPWPRGYPEIYLIYAYEGIGQCITQYFPNIDKPGKYYLGDGTNFTIRNYPANRGWKILMYDEDFGFSTKEINIELTYQNNGMEIKTQIPVQIGNADDKMGETELDFFHTQNHNAKLGTVASIVLNYKER